MYVGPEIDDVEILEALPPEYRRLLQQANGYVAYQGGLHVRGACLRPEWHSLRHAWFGDDALHRLYPEVLADDVPFAEDALGDQFLVRAGRVWRLSAESGEVASLGLTLVEFDRAVRADPSEFLALGPLHQLLEEGSRLEPGQLLSVSPPFVFKESADGVSVRAIPNLECRRFLADLARQIREFPDGTPIVLRRVP